MIRSYIALGANLGDAGETLRAAVRALASQPGIRMVVAASHYRTAPVGLLDQPDFINSVVAVESEHSATHMLALLFGIEQDFGRQRSVANGPRTLDLDLLLHGDTISNDADLTLPHPRMHERAFVLAPLAEIAPELVIPGRGTVAELLAGCTDQRIERI